MLSVNEFREEVLAPILVRFAEDQSLANAYCTIWAIDAYATHVALEGLGNANNAYSLEKKFKDRLSKRSWQFRAIREASNATKHAIRKSNAKDVMRSSDVKPNTGIDWYAYFNNVDGGVTIDLDWNYHPEDSTFSDINGTKVEGFSGVGSRIYLSNAVEEAIAAIDEADEHPE